MLNFCTLFDSNYLTRGLALYSSLQQTCPSFHLYVFAFDDQCYKLLKSKDQPHLTVISLKEFEDEALLKVKPTRSVAEYCWTSTPSTILYCLEKYKLPHCTYVDADMFFYDDPQVLMDEMGANSIMISEHRYTKAYDQSATSGIYCVQFVCFKNDERGLETLKWWRERCLEWCYARFEDGKFGDQKYLDDWTTRFEGVHVIQHAGEGLAPWNIQKVTVSRENNKLFVTEKNTRRMYPAIYFHFHGLKFYSDKTVSLCGPLYEIEDAVRQFFYFPYIQTLSAIEKELQEQGFLQNSTGAYHPAPLKWRVYINFLKETLQQVAKGRASLFHIKNFNFSRHYHYYRLNQIV